VTTLITTPATTQDLTTLDIVKNELSITGNAEDPRIKRMITSVSGLFAHLTGRKFGAEAVVEDISGHRQLRLVLDRIPILTVQSITRDLQDIESTEYLIEDPEKGFLFREAGWRSHLPLAINTAGTDLLNELGEQVWRVSYNGGYYLPSFAGSLLGDKTISGITLTATTVFITSTAHGYVGGERVRLQDIVGTTSLNSREFGVDVTGITANGFFLLDPKTSQREPGDGLTAWSSAGTAVVYPKLPFEIEDLAIQAIRSRRLTMDRDPTIKAERLGDWNAVYEIGESGLPKSIEHRLMAFTRVGQA